MSNDPDDLTLHIPQLQINARAHRLDAARRTNGVLRKRSAIAAACIASTLGLIACSSTDRFSSELDRAYAARESNEDVTRVVQQWFPVGMPADGAFKELAELAKAGFTISESQHGGARRWPQGELRPYTDEATKRNLQNLIPPGTSVYTAQKLYARHYLIVENTAVVSIRIENFVVSSATGRINIHGI